MAPGEGFVSVVIDEISVKTTTLTTLLLSFRTFFHVNSSYNSFILRKLGYGMTGRVFTIKLTVLEGICCEFVY